MTSCDVDMVSCKDKEKQEGRSESERSDALDEVNVSHDPTSKSPIVRNASLEKDKNVDPVINNSLESDVIDSRCNLETNCSQPKKKSKRRKRNSEVKQDVQIEKSSRKGKRKTKVKQDVQIESQLGSPIKNATDSIKTCEIGPVEAVSVINTDLEIDLPQSEVKQDVKIKKSSRKRKRKSKVKQDVQIESQLGSPPNRNSTDSIKTCETGPVEAVSDINNLEIDLPQKLTRSQKKRIKIKEKKKKLNGTVINETAVKEEPINVATHSPADQKEVDSSELSKNEFERVKADETVVSVSVVENASSNCSNGESVLLESKNITENKRNSNIDVPNMEDNHSQSQKEVDSSELSKNEFERVKADETLVSVSAVENASSNCSNGESVLLESKNITENKRNSNIDVPNMEDNHSQVSDSSTEGSQLGCVKKKLLILDVNGLLADIVPFFHHKADIIISKKSVFLRPFCRDFLQFCFQKFNVGVWSSRTKRNVDTAVDFLFKDSRRKLLFCWDQSHCTRTGFTTVENLDKPLVLKELKKLWDKLEPDLPWNKGEYNESNTLLLDDSPYKALCNPANTAIFPYPYLHKNAKDSSLGPGGDLRVYLEKLAEAPNVQEFVAQNPFGQRAITESNPSWGFYRRILTAAESIKIEDVDTSAEQQSPTQDLE